jgi:general secretion pathway protein H
MTVAEWPVSRQPCRGGFRAAGYTLIELLVVLVIASLLLAVVPPMLSAAMPGAKVRSAARQLAASLRYARHEAITQRREVALTLDLEGRRYSVQDKARVSRLPDGLVLALTTGRAEVIGEQQGMIRFFPDGSSSGGRIEVASGEHRSTVDVNWLTGRVTVDE